MKYFKVIYFSFIISILGCHRKSTLEDNLPVSSKGIIISCIRCGCMVEVLNNYLKMPLNDNEIKIYGDQNCFPEIAGLNFIRLSQRQMDSLYKSNFNIVLFKKERNSINYRVIQTNEALMFQEIAKEYFK